jgi:hypothetical protein
MRDEQSAERLTQEVKELRSQSAEVERFAGQLESSSQRKLEELLKIYAASGFVAIYPASGSAHLDERAEVLLECQLYDVSGAREMLRSQGWKEEATAGRTVYVNSKHWFCVEGQALLCASSRSLLERALEATGHKHTLDRDPKFQQAMAQLPGLGKSNGTAFYCDFDSCWTSLEKLGNEHVDQGTMSGLRTVPYAIAGLMKQSGEWRAQGFLAIDSKSQHALAQAILKTPSSSAALAALVPEGWGCFQGFDVIYAFDLLVEMIRLVPRGRMGVGFGLAYLGLFPGGARDKSIRQAFGGDVAWTLDLATAGSLARSSLAPRPRPTLSYAGHGALMVGIKDAAEARKLLQPLATEKVTLGGREGFRLSYQGADLFGLLLESPPALLVSAGPNGKESLTQMVDCAAGRTPSMARKKAFSSFASAFGNRTALLSYLEVGLLADGLRGALEGKQGRPGVDLLKSLLNVDDLLVPDRWSVQIEHDGVRVTHQGTSVILGLGGAALALQAVPGQPAMTSTRRPGRKHRRRARTPY